MDGVDIIKLFPWIMPCNDRSFPISVNISDSTWRVRCMHTFLSLSLALSHGPLPLYIFDPKSPRPRLLCLISSEMEPWR